MVTTKRNPSGIYRIVQDGTNIGETWKWPRSKGWAVRIELVYWHKMIPSRISGQTTATVPFLRDVPAFVERTLREVPNGEALKA